MKGPVSVALTVLGLLLAGFVLLGVVGDPKAFPPRLVLWVPWLAFAVTAGALAVGSATEADRSTVFACVALAAEAGSALAVLALAVAAGRENFWDAIHFASLYWCALASALVALWALIRVGRRGSELAVTLAWLDALLVGACALLWAWMSLPIVQDLQGWIARTLYLLTHG